MTARRLFVGADGRPHAPWRLMLFLLLALLCTVVLIVLAPALALLQLWTGIEGTGEAYGLTIVLLLAHWFALKLIDKRPWSFVWLDAAAARPRVLVYGWMLGAAPILIPSLLLLAVGLLSVQSMPEGSWLLAAAKVSAVLIPAALSEELFSRGYIFTTLKEWLGPVVAIGITSVGFGLLHLGNSGWTGMSITMVILAGVYLGVMVLVTKSLYAAWMAHWAWNWMMAVPLHTPVSGIPIPRPDYQVVDAGPDWVTGGVWGPEGGVGAGLGMLAGLAFLYWKRRATPTISNDQIER